MPGSLQIYFSSCQDKTYNCAAYLVIFNKINGSAVSQKDTKIAQIFGLR